MSDPALISLALSLQSGKGCVTVTLLVGGSILEGVLITFEQYTSHVESEWGVAGKPAHHSTSIGGEVLYLKAPRVRHGADTITFSAAIMRVPVSSVDGWFFGVEPPDVPAWKSAAAEATDARADDAKAS